MIKLFSLGNLILKLCWGIRAILFKPFFGKIGAMTYIGKTIYIHGAHSIFLGKRVRIYPMLRAEVYGTGQIYIDDEVSIGHNFHISALQNIYIGKKTTISSNVFIGSLNHSYENIGIHIMDQPYIGKVTKIGENCFIGTGAILLPGTILGKQCIVGANSVVKGEFNDFCVIEGNPAKVIKQYNHTTMLWEKLP